MLSKVLAAYSILSIANGLISEPQIDRQYSDNVRSDGYTLMYGDEDMMVVNQVVQEYEKSELLKSKADPKTTIQPLPAMDVKCLMSVDSYCSKDMFEVKSILIQALKENCKKCSSAEKDRAGRVIASMMTYDRAAWKLFLTRYHGQDAVDRIVGQQFSSCSKMRVVGKPEFVENKRNRFTTPGVSVRVQKYTLEPY